MTLENMAKSITDHCILFCIAELMIPGRFVLAILSSLTVGVRIASSKGQSQHGSRSLRPLYVILRIVGLTIVHCQVHSHVDDIVA